MAAPIYIPTNKVGGFSFLHIIIRICCLCLFFFFFGRASGIWKFPGQGSNPSHSCSLSHCSDNTRSKNCCNTGVFPVFVLFDDRHSDRLRHYLIALLLNSVTWFCQCFINVLLRFSYLVWGWHKLMITLKLYRVSVTNELDTLFK